MKRSSKTKSYLTPNEVADLLMVSPVTIRQWAQKGAIRAQVTPGGHRRFLREDVEEFARKRGLTLPAFEEDELRVLVVDDDEQVAGFLKEVLHNRMEAVQCEAAYDGFEAGRKVQTFKPHVILLDLMMPGLDGFEVCRRLKEEAATRTIRVIAMTGYHTPENLERVVKAGAETCLPKPLDIALLMNLLRLGSRRLAARTAAS